MRKPTLYQHAIALLCGILFGAGLALSGMTNPAKVIGFLDITGAWDITLMFVMGGGLLITMPAFQWMAKAIEHPLWAAQFRLPRKTQLDWQLIVGAGIFGLGWGLYGYCPGPAIAALAYGQLTPLLFIPAMVAGMMLANVFRK